MKNKLFVMVGVLLSNYGFAQDSNIIIDMGGPIYGITAKMNFPGYSGSYARGYFFSNEDISKTFMGIGVYGGVLNGKSEMSYGWIGNNWDNPFMSFLTNGNVGMGIIEPAEKLSVNGNIRAKEIKVETTNWPDYVFEADYKKLSLAELEKYISLNKRLPEIPSATEAQTNGIELGEMNKLLLKKIEELTLHLIEKDKVISTLIKRMDAFEQSVKSIKN